MKQKLFVFLATMVFTANAWSQIFNIDGIRYNIISKDSALVEIIGTNPKYSGNFFIPEKIIFNESTYTVTAIGSHAFAYCYDLTSVIIPESVTTIKTSAFIYCNSLTSITIPSSVTTIGKLAFSNCDNLTTITIPSSVTAIGDFAFSLCHSLTSFNVEEGNMYFTSVRGVLYNKDVSTIIQYPIGNSSNSCELPSTVKTIGECAFIDCSILTSITIPSSVTTIGKYAFLKCINLTSITIPPLVTTIFEGIFKDCSGLTSITIPSTVTTINYYAFSGCSSLTSLILPSSLKTIGNNAFYACSGLTSITIPSSVTTIGDYSFYNCNSLPSLIIPSSVTRIGEYAFCECMKLTSIQIPSSVTSIGIYAFAGCTALNLVIADAKIPVISTLVFMGVPTSTCVIRVPFGSQSLYKATPDWKYFVNIEEMKTPATSLCSTFRNTILSNLSSPIACYSVARATSYQWLFVSGSDTTRATSSDTTIIPGTAGLKFYSEYTVSIRTKVGDSWIEPVEGFTIATPATRSTTLAATYRSATMKDWKSLFRAHYMGGATRYEFVFTDIATGKVLTYLSKNHAMCFKSLAGAQAGHTYVLKIRPWYGMSEGTFGTSFSITAPK